MENVEWGEFAIGDLFDVQASKKRFDANKVKLLNKSGYPYVVRTSQNNGIKGLLDAPVEFLNSGNTLSFGQDTATVYYQKNPYFTGDKIKILQPKIELFSKKNAQFFVAAINQSFSSFEWGVGSYSIKVIESQSIKLPVSGREIDFDFIESFLAELEAAHLAELEAYLEASGLDNYILTPEEEAIVSNFDSLNWKEFSVEDIFEKISVKKVSKSDVQKNRSEIFATPVVYCKYGDNGIMYWAKNGVAEVRDNIISVVYNGAIAAGKVYAQKESTGILAESYFISHKQNPGNHEINLFLSAALEKVLYPKYSRDFLATWSGRVQKDILILPSGLDDVIDYESILILISAIKKIIIKDLVEYAQSKSVVTRQVIQNR
ncbi:restriction endonuclease subunit S [Rothia sp. L_38]|uniref:restriction endonuclease subunit S n=1 Tax=Rothia sp. L_38 TaxID=3422315 RepID=UPI003D6C5022